MSSLRETVTSLRALVTEGGVGPGTYLELVKRPSDSQTWFQVLAPTKSGFKGRQVVHWLGDRKPKAAKQTFIRQIELDHGAWKVVTASDLPPGVLQRFES